MNKEQQLQKTLDELSINKISSDHAQSIIEQLFKTDAPKMISVEAVKEFIHKHVFYQEDDELIDADQLLTFLNTHTNVK